MLIIIVIVHLVLFVSMFFIKNVLLTRKSKKSIRGKNKEAVLSIILINITIYVSIASILSEYLNSLFIPINFSNSSIFIFIGILFLFLSLIISLLALLQMKDSWRVGIIEGEKTELVTTGIFGISRNPYFVSYIFLFVAYILLISNLFVIALSLLSFFSIHKMILKEEQHLESLHGASYIEYKKRTARYLVI